MKHITISIGVAIILAAGLQALPVSPDLKFETPEEKVRTEKENIRRKKPDISSPIETFIHQLPIQLQLSSQQQSIPLRGLFTGHTFPSNSGQSIPFYSPIEIFQIPRNAIIQSNDNYFQSVSVPQPQLVKIPDFNPTVSSGTFDPSQPTQIILQRVPYVVEIIDKSKSTDTSNSQKENNPLGMDSEKSSMLMTSINLKQNHVRSDAETINLDTQTKDPEIINKNIDSLAKEPKETISLNSKVEDAILEKDESIPVGLEIAPTSSLLEGEEKIILNGEESPSLKEIKTLKSINSQLNVHDTVNIQEPHEETLEEIIDRILFEYENSPAANDQNNNHEMFQNVTEEKLPTAHLRSSIPNEALPLTFQPTEVKTSQSPIERFMKFGIEPPKLGSFGLKMLPHNEVKNEKNSIHSGKIINSAPASFASITRSINSIPKSIFNLNRQQDTSINLNINSPEILHDSTKNEMLSTEEIFALLDQEIDKNISLPKLINRPIDSEFASNLTLTLNQNKNIDIDNNSLTLESLFKNVNEEDSLTAETLSKTENLLSNNVFVNSSPINNGEFIEDSFSGGKSLDLQSGKVKLHAIDKDQEQIAIDKDQEQMIAIPNENLDSITETSPVSKDEGNRNNGVIPLANSEVLENKMEDAEPVSKTEEATHASQGKFDDELANLLTEIVAEAVREFLVNKKVVAIPKQLTEDQKEEGKIPLNIVKTNNSQFNDPRSVDSDLIVQRLLQRNFSEEATEIIKNNKDLLIPDKFDENQLLDAGNSSSSISLPISDFEEHNRLDHKLISDSFSVVQQTLTEIDPDLLNLTQQKKEFSIPMEFKIITAAEETAETITTESIQTTEIVSESPLFESQLDNYEEVNLSDREIPTSDDFDTNQQQLSNSNNDAVTESLPFHLIQIQGLDNKVAVPIDGVVQPNSLTIEQEIESILDYINETSISTNPEFEIPNENEYFSTTVNVVEEETESETDNINGHFDSITSLEMPIIINEENSSNLLSSSIILDATFVTTTDATLLIDLFDAEEPDFAIKKESNKAILEQIELNLQTEYPSLTTDSQPIWESFTEANDDSMKGIEEISVIDNLDLHDMEIDSKDTEKSLAVLGNEETFQVNGSIPIIDADADNKTREKVELSRKISDSPVTSITEANIIPDTILHNSQIIENTQEDKVFNETWNEDYKLANGEEVSILNLSEISNDNRELNTSIKMDEMDLSLFFLNGKINTEKQFKNIIDMAVEMASQNKSQNEMDTPIDEQKEPTKEFPPNNNFQMKTTLAISDDIDKEVNDERLPVSLILDDAKSDNTLIANNLKVIESLSLNPNLGLDFQLNPTILKNNVNRNETQLDVNINDDFIQPKEEADSSSNPLSKNLKLLSKFKLSTTGSKMDKTSHPGSQFPKVLVPKIVTFFHQVESDTSPSIIANENKKEVLDERLEPENFIEVDGIPPTNFQAISEDGLVKIVNNMNAMNVKNTTEGEKQMSELSDKDDTTDDITTEFEIPFTKNTKIEQIISFPEQKSTHLPFPIEEVLESQSLTTNAGKNDELHFIETDLKKDVQEEKQFFDNQELNTPSYELNINDDDNLNHTKDFIMDLKEKDIKLESLNEGGSLPDQKMATMLTTNSSFEIVTIREIIPVDQSADEAKQSSISKLIDSFTNTSGDHEEIHLPIVPILLTELQSRTNEAQNAELNPPPGNKLSLSPNSKENNDPNERVEVTVVSSRKSVSFLDPNFRRRPNLFRRPNVTSIQKTLFNVPKAEAIKPINIANIKKPSENKDQEKKITEDTINKKEILEAEERKTEITQGRSIIDRLLKELKLVKRDSSFGTNHENKTSTVDQMIKVFEKTSNLKEDQVDGFIENLKKITQTFLQQKTDTELPMPKFVREISGIPSKYTVDSKNELMNKNSAESNYFNNATNLSLINLNLTFPLLEMLEKEFSLKDENQSKKKREKFQIMPGVMEEQLLPLTKLFKKQSINVNNQEPILSTSSDKHGNKIQSSEILLQNSTNSLHTRQNIDLNNASHDFKESVQNEFEQHVNEPIKPSLLLSVSHVQSGRSLFSPSLLLEDEFQPIINIEYLEKSKPKTIK